MKKQTKVLITASILALILFIGWTLALGFVDVGAIGPLGSEVGFSTVNGAFHSLTGVNMTLYTLTDWLGLVPIAFALGFAVLGLAEWIKRRSLPRVDYSLFVLGGFYIAVIAAYIFFEIVVVNRRPVLIDGYLEASYPSSTTMLVLTVMPTAIAELLPRIKSKPARLVASSIISAFTLFMLVGRLISGVHWLSDIIGGATLSAALVLGYFAALSIKKREN